MFKIEISLSENTSKVLTALSAAIMAVASAQPAKAEVSGPASERKTLPFPDGGVTTEVKADAPVVAKPEPAKAPAAKPTVTTPAAEAKKPGRPAAEVMGADTFAALDADGQLEAIKAEVTKHTKKGKSADIKALLAHFDSDRASNLQPEQYGDFFSAITRYGAGETVDAITGSEDLS